MSHKYRLGQLVRLTRLAFARSDVGETFEVTRLMPADVTGEFSYRVKSATGGERAVREAEIISLVQLHE